MNIDFSQLIYTLSYAIIPIIFAVAYHEAGHAYVAKWLGDDTADRQGLATLNPMVQIDPFGTVILPLMTYLLTGLVFGYAKTPFNASRLRNPDRDAPLVYLAGPAANAVMALIWGVFAILFQTFLPQEVFFEKMTSVGVIVNLLFFAFNLLPLPPLDGGRILIHMLPTNLARSLAAVEQYSMLIIILLAVSGGNIIGKYWVTPIMSVMLNLIEVILSPLRAVFGV